MLFLDKHVGVVGVGSLKYFLFYNLGLRDYTPELNVFVLNLD